MRTAEVLNALGRLARHAALEEQLAREGAPNLEAAVAAIRRESRAVMERFGFHDDCDERGNCWIALEGQPLVFVGYDERRDQTQMTLDAACAQALTPAR